MGFDIYVNHQRNQRTPSHCAMCQDVECLLLLLLLMSLVELLMMFGYVALPMKAKWEVDMWRGIMCYNTVDFPCEDLF